MTNSQKVQLHVLDRIKKSSNISKLRKSNQIPANMYGMGVDSQALSIGKSDFVRHLKAEGESSLVYLVVDNKDEVPVLIEEIQTHPVTGDPIHVSFKRVNLKVKVRVEVPLEMVGEADIPNATIFLTKDVLEVEALPADLPEEITVDISGLTEIGQSLHLKDAQFDRDKVTVILTEEEEDEPLVIVQELKEEAAEEVATEPVEGESEAVPASDSESTESPEKAAE